MPGTEPIAVVVVDGEFDDDCALRMGRLGAVPLGGEVLTLATLVRSIGELRDPVGVTIMGRPL